MGARTVHSRRLPMRVAALLAAVAGTGFGFFCVPAIWYCVEYGKVWNAFGYPTYGEGPFERVGISTSVPLLSAFLLVCVVEVVTAWMLWHLQPSGVWTSSAPAAHRTDPADGHRRSEVLRRVRLPRSTRTVSR